MNVLEKFRQVSTFVFDVDGVLTDGTVLLLENGLQARRMNVKDGLALQMAKRQGYRVVIISGAASEPVINRFLYLGIDEIHTGVKDKAHFLELFLQQNQLGWEEVLFMGDDLPDLSCIRKAGLGTCPADAVTEIQQAAAYVSPLGGGQGCVRDVIEKVLKLNDHWHFETELTSR